MSIRGRLRQAGEAIGDGRPRPPPVDDRQTPPSAPPRRPGCISRQTCDPLRSRDRIRRSSWNRSRDTRDRPRRTEHGSRLTMPRRLRSGQLARMPRHRHRARRCCLGRCALKRTGPRAFRLEGPLPAPPPRLTLRARGTCVVPRSCPASASASSSVPAFRHRVEVFRRRPRERPAVAAVEVPDHEGRGDQAATTATTIMPSDHGHPHVLLGARSALDRTRRQKGESSPMAVRCGAVVGPRTTHVVTGRNAPVVRRSSARPRARPAGVTRRPSSSSDTRRRAIMAG